MLVHPSNATDRSYKRDRICTKRFVDNALAKMGRKGGPR
jgi:hypothetical protein